MPASRRARAMIFAPRSCPSRPGLATTTRILRAVDGALLAASSAEASMGGGSVELRGQRAGGQRAGGQRAEGRVGAPPSALCPLPSALCPLEDRRLPVGAEDLLERRNDLALRRVGAGAVEQRL